MEMMNIDFMVLSQSKRGNGMEETKGGQNFIL